MSSKETSTQRKRRLSLKKKLDSIASNAFKKWLASQGESKLMLSDEWSPGSPDIAVSYVVSCPFTIGNKNFVREVRRTFRKYKPTVVPTMVAGHFLTPGIIVEFRETGASK